MKAKKKTLRKIGITIFVTLFTMGFAIAQPPKWAKARKYKKETHYVYFPERNFYYDTQTNVYFIWGGNNWVTYRTLPTSYASFDFYGGRHVELSIETAHPYYYNREHYRTYYVAPAPNPRPQPRPENRVRVQVRTAPIIVIDSRPVYREVEHYEVHDHGNDHGHGEGHGNGHGKRHGKHH